MNNQTLIILGVVAAGAVTVVLLTRRSSGHGAGELAAAAQQPVAQPQQPAQARASGSGGVWGTFNNVIGAASSLAELGNDFSDLWGH